MMPRVTQKVNACNRKMRKLQVFLCLLASFPGAAAQCLDQSSEFHLKGDYLIGGLFNIHHTTITHFQRPQTVDCASSPFLLPNYRRFHLMRFSVEEINNSTSILPDVSLGYEMFDHCSDIHSFPGVFKLLSVNSSIQPWERPSMSPLKAISVVGPFTSTRALTVAPLFMPDLIPMISYGSSSSVFSRKVLYPSFFRTVHPNKDVIRAIVDIISTFKWRWISFLHSDDDFGRDGLEELKNTIRESDMCLAYYKELDKNTNYLEMFKQIEAQKINIIVVFAPKVSAEAVIESAVQLNITGKVWIADDGWSLNHKLQKTEGIQKIGTVLGVSQPVVNIPGFAEFIHSAKSHCTDSPEQTFCNQMCNCSQRNYDLVLEADPSFSFSVYAAVYAIAHALHHTLKCEAGGCHKDTTVQPHMVLEELKKSNFTLLSQRIQFDEKGDPNFGSLAVVFWNRSGEAEKVGTYHFQPIMHLSINKTKIHWFTGGEVPVALCSPECPIGHMKNQMGVHKCCFTCEICPEMTYINITENPHRCSRCKDSEWSTEGSTSCTPRQLEYIPFKDTAAIVVMSLVGILLALILGVTALFVLNYNTPVVRSAGGPMCFLNLGCLSLCGLSVFFYFERPTLPFCVLRFFPFVLFYTVCLSCLVVRSFQIVCIFKISAQIPNIHIWWMKYHGQWLLVGMVFALQTILVVASFSYDPPKPYNETSWETEKIVLSCAWNLETSVISLFLPVLLCCLCFIFSYMGKNLPKNYNEAKAITFCLFLLMGTWIIFITEYMLYHGKYILLYNSMAVLSSLYSFLLWYFLPKCYIILFQPSKNTPQFFQGLIQSYTKTISQ